MNFTRLLILLLATITLVQANPRQRHRPYSHHRNYYTSSFYASRYNPHYYPYRSYRYYTPVVITSRTTTTYPTDLVVVTADQIADEIIALNDLMTRGMITKKDYGRVKKTLLNRIGMSVNPEAEGASTIEIISQINTLYRMQSSQLLTEQEYLKQKKKLLAMI